MKSYNDRPLIFSYKDIFYVKLTRVEKKQCIVLS